MCTSALPPVSALLLVQPVGEWSHWSCGLVAAWWLLRPLVEMLCSLEPAPTCSGVLAKQRAIFLVLFSGEPADSARWNGFVQVLMNVEAGTRERVGTCSRREVRDYASQDLVWLRLLWNCSLRAVRDLLMWGFLLGYLGLVGFIVCLVFFFLDWGLLCLFNELKRLA